MSDIDKFFMDNGEMSPFGENGCLFAFDYAMLYGNHQRFLNAVSGVYVDDLHLQAGDNPWSHDNHTGFVAASSILGFYFHRKYFYKYWWRRAHPRDIFFYLFMTIGNPNRPGLLGLLLLPTWFFTILSCFRVSEQRSTGGKLAFWRLLSVNAPLVRRICTYIVTKKVGGWKRVYEIYYKDPSHPNRLAADYLYNLFC
jgi:hypothetical protein